MSMRRRSYMITAIQKMRASDEKGFTLVELLIVIAIIAILAAIAIPQFAQYQQRAIRATMQSDAKNTATMEEAYFADNQIYLNLAQTGAQFSIGSTTGKPSKGNLVQVTGASVSAYTIAVSNGAGGAGSLNFSMDNGGNTGYY